MTHVDGSGRLQTVYQSANPRYHALISAFRDLTGVPMVLNTSFNENEPVVCKPEEALDCFLRTKMDLLVLGEIVVVREPKSRQDLVGGTSSFGVTSELSADPKEHRAMKRWRFTLMIRLLRFSRSGKRALSSIPERLPMGRCSAGYERQGSQ